MTIDEAIKHLGDYLHFEEKCYNPDLYKAFKLGIEALKRQQEYRKSFPSMTQLKLPGETEE